MLRAILIYLVGSVAAVVMAVVVGLALVVVALVSVAAYPFATLYKRTTVKRG